MGWTRQRSPFIAALGFIEVTMDYRVALEFLELDELDELDITIGIIQKSFKKMASKYHPDKETGSDELMAKLNRAKEVLLEKYSPTNLIVISKNLELAIAKTNQATEVQRKLEGQASTLKIESLSDATHRLHHMKNVAFVLMAISALMLFLGKDLPKEFVSFFHLAPLSALEVVDKPKGSDLTKQYLRENGSDFSINSAEEMLYFMEKMEKMEKLKKADQKYNDKEKQELKSYLYQMIDYERYMRQKEHIDLYNKQVTLIWYVFIFTLAGVSSFLAWRLTFRIKKVENLLNEFYGDLQIRSNYFRIISSIFSGEIPDEWTFEKMQHSLREARFGDEDIGILKYYLTTKKVCQILIIKGQEGGFLKVNNGSFQERYSLATG